MGDVGFQFLGILDFVLKNDILFRYTQMFSK